MTKKPKYKLTLLGKVVIIVLCTLVICIACIIGYIKNSNKIKSYSLKKVQQTQNKSSDSNASKNTRAKNEEKKEAVQDKKEDTSVKKKLIGTLYFDSNDINLSQDSLAAAQDIAKSISGYKNAYIEIQGNTADTSDTLDNGNSQIDDIISYERAKAVAEYLKSKGIAMDKVILIANGSKNPADTNSTDEGRSKNRRVDINIITN